MGCAEEESRAGAGGGGSARELSGIADGFNALNISNERAPEVEMEDEEIEEEQSATVGARVDDSNGDALGLAAARAASVYY